jgi:hypothetical protein
VNDWPPALNTVKASRQLPRTVHVPAKPSPGDQFGWDAPTQLSLQVPLTAPDDDTDQDACWPAPILVGPMIVAVNGWTVNDFDVVAVWPAAFRTVRLSVHCPGAVHVPM